MEKNTTDPSSVPDDSNDPAKGATITSTEHEKTPERHSQEQPAESDSIIDVVGKKASEQRAAKPPVLDDDSKNEDVASGSENEGSPPVPTKQLKKGNLKEADTREDDEIAEKSNTETTSRKRKRKYIVFII